MRPSAAVSRLARVAPIAALAALLSAAGCRAPSADAGVEAVSEEAPMLVGPELYATAVRSVLPSGPRIEGSLEPRRRAVLRAQVGGTVLRTSAEVGEPVAAGQVLAQIAADGVEDAVRSARFSVLSLEREAELAGRQVQRTRRLVSAGALADHDLEAAESAEFGAKARLESARAQLTLAREQLDHARVVAPISGIVSAREAHEGDVLSAGAPLFTIVDPSTMQLDAAVSSRDIGALALGVPVEFTVHGYPGQSFVGRIARIAPAADPFTRQLPIVVSIPNPGGRLVSGLFAEGFVKIHERPALVVPTAAVPEGTSAVTRVRAGRTERVVVSVGVRDERNDRVEILAGLEAGDAVLLGPAAALPPGTPVELRAAGRPDEAGPSEPELGT